MNYTTDFESMRGQVSAQEWQTRLDLAACYRLVDIYGMTDLIYNHITARIPGSQDHLLINLYGMLYKEITASSLVKIDVEGEIIWKPDTERSTRPGMFYSENRLDSSRGARWRDAATIVGC
jgi:ribulose-5-phosphate 4-epimerase/fuculose-1-phosphate aldolase